MMMGVNMALPDPVEGHNTPQRGDEVREHEFFPARTIGSSAARRYNQEGAFAAATES
jgi:hypothetical protein